MLHDVFKFKIQNEFDIASNSRVLYSILSYCYMIPIQLVCIPMPSLTSPNYPLSSNVSNVFNRIQIPGRHNSTSLPC